MRRRATHRSALLWLRPAAYRTAGSGLTGAPALSNVPDSGGRAPDSRPVGTQSSRTAHWASGIDQGIGTRSSVSPTPNWSSANVDRAPNTAVCRRAGP
jgi:hypothetical protein